MIETATATSVLGKIASGLKAPQSRQKHKVGRLRERATAFQAKGRAGKATKLFKRAHKVERKYAPITMRTRVATKPVMKDKP